MISLVSIQFLMIAILQLPPSAMTLDNYRSTLNRYLQEIDKLSFKRRSKYVDASGKMHIYNNEIIRGLNKEIRYTIETIEADGSKNYRVYCSNSKYAFELERKDGSYLLLQVGKKDNPAIRYIIDECSEASRLSYAGVSFRSTKQYCMVSMFKHNNYKAEMSVDNDPGSNRNVISVKRIQDISKKEYLAIGRGFLLNNVEPVFGKAVCHCTFTDGEGVRTHEFKYDTVIGISVPIEDKYIESNILKNGKSVAMHGNAEFSYTSEYATSDQFTLSAFKLPEPKHLFQGDNLVSAIPWFMYIAVSGAILLLFATWLAYRKRKHLLKQNNMSDRG